MPAASGAAVVVSRRRSRSWLVGLAALSAATAVVIGFVIVRPSAADPSPPESAAPTAVIPTTPTIPSSGGSSRDETVPSTIAGPAEELDAIVAADATAVASLEGVWVPQVSSKRVGLLADGIEYDEDAILADHLRWQSTYPNAVLFESDRFATYSSSGFYVTALALPFSTASEANAWCDAAGLSADSCYAKRLSQSVGSGPNSVNR